MYETKLVVSGSYISDDSDGSDDPYVNENTRNRMEILIEMINITMMQMNTYNDVVPSELVDTSMLETTDSNIC
jgi:hypothetical protein